MTQLPATYITWPSVRDLDPDSCWPHLNRLGLAQVHLDVELDDSVRAARAAGLSWADIAGALGMTRQAAHQRWAETRSRAHPHQLSL